MMRGIHHVGAAAPGRATPTSEKAPDAANGGGPAKIEPHHFILEQPADKGKQAPAVDLAEAARFLDMLVEGDPVTFQTFDDDPAGKRPELARVLHGELDAHAARLSSLNAAGAGIFWMINHGDGVGRAIGNVTGIRALFLDLDGPPLAPVLAAGVEPHAVVESSPGKWHVYWLVTGCPLVQFKPTQQTLAAKFGGDMTVCDLPRVLRVPGFQHRKGEPFTVRIVSVEAMQPYPFDELVGQLALDVSAPTPAPAAPRVDAAPVPPVGKVTHPGRHEHLRRKLADLNWRGIPEAGIRAALHQINEADCEPPKTSAEVDGLVNDFLQRYATQHGKDLDQQPHANDAASRVDAWPEPTPLPDELPPVEAFDPDLLPAALKGWIMDISHRMQCPPDFSAVAAVSALSSLIGARAVVKPKERDDWAVVSNLWALAIGRPGVMKSPAISEVLRPLHRLQADERQRWQTAFQEWELDQKVSELDSADREKKAKKAISTDKVKAKELLRTDEGGEPEPTKREFIVNDATVEAFQEVLAVNPWGTLAYRDEIFGLLTSLDKQGQEGSRAFYLTGYDGDKGHTTLRIVRGETYIKRVCIAMLGGIQPSRIQSYVRGAVEGGAADDGLLQRFGLAVWPDVAPEFTYVDQWPDTPSRQQANAVFDRLAALEADGDDDPQVWRFSAEAQPLFIEWYTASRQELKRGELHPAMESHLSKYAKLIPALALIFALVDTPDSDRQIQVHELLRALAWGQYLRSHAERLYSAATKPETAGATALLSKIVTGKLADGDGVIPSRFTPRQVAVKHWAGLTSPDEVRKAADLLVDFDWLRHEVTPPGPAGGRPSECYAINPAALRRKGGAS